MLLGLMLPVVGIGTDGDLAIPSAPSFSVVPGGADGEVDWTVSALPASWGDLIVPGDEDGVAGILQWWNEVDGWQELNDPAATGSGTFLLDARLWGVLAAIRIRGVSAAGVEGLAASAEVMVPPVPVDPGDDAGIGEMKIGSTFKVR